MVFELTTYAVVVREAIISKSESELLQKEKTRKKGRKMEMEEGSQYQGNSQNCFSKEPGFQPRKNVSFKRPEVGSVGQGNRLQNTS